MKSTMKTLAILFLFCISAYASGTINCTNNSSSDLGLINSALSGGGTNVVNGPCNVNGQINIGVNGTIFTAGTNPVLTETTNGNIILSVTASSVTIHGIDFEHGIFNFNGTLTGFTFTGNTVANATGGSFTNGGMIVSNGFINSFIDSNNLDNGFSGGYNDLTTQYPSYPGPIQPACWQDYQGMSGTTITHNRFTRCANDGFHINPGGSVRSTAKNVFSYNYFAQVHRASVELQAFMGTAGFDMYGNVAINSNAPFFDSFAFSIASQGTNFVFANNLGSLNSQYCEGGVASFLEEMIGNATVRGNVNAQLPIDTNKCFLFSNGGSSAYSPTFIAAGQGDGTNNPSNTITAQNNILCGNSYVTQIDLYDGTANPRNVVDQYNYKNTSTCPNGATSVVTSIVGNPVFVSPPTAFPSFGSGTWNISEISNIPILNVTFTVDGAVVATQELQDVSTTFASDRKWLYHVTYNTTGLSSGTHTLQAIATDVLGATATSSSTFTAGSSTTPVVSLSPTSLTFGSTTTGTSSSPLAVNLTNTGGGSLTISSIVASGNFSQTNTCGSTVAAGAHCVISVVFSPTGAVGAKTGAISITDNATGSPHTVSLAGTNVALAACGGILSNCDFSGGTNSWLLAAGSLGSWVVDTSGPSSVNAAHVSVTASVPPGSNIELYQDNVTYPANGTHMALTFKANTNRAQAVNVLGILSVSPYTSYGLAYMPTLTVGWNTYTINFTVSGTPTAGTGRFTIQMDNSQNGDQIYFTDISLTTISSVEVNNIIFPARSLKHGGLQVAFTTLTDSVGGRIRYIPSASGTCVNGTGGQIYTNQSTFIPHAFWSTPVGGLAANTQYDMCPEVTKDGTTWSTGAHALVTTPALPLVHPVPPQKPVDFPTSITDTLGATPSTTCHQDTVTDNASFSSAYASAVGRQLSTCSVINATPGSVITTTTGSPFAYSLTPPDVHIMHTSDINLTTSVITWTAHGLNEGDRVSISNVYKANETMPVCASCDVGFGSIIGGGLQSGQLYPVHYLSANTFSLFCLDGVTPMVFTTVGVDSGNIGFYVTPFGKVNGKFTRNRLKWIQVRSGAADTSLPPEHTQITAAYHSQMATFLDPATNVTSGFSYSKAFMLFGDSDPNHEVPTGNIRLGPGIEITTQDYGTTAHSNDPNYYSAILMTFPWSSDIIYDRIWYHLLGVPNRANTDMYFDGANVAALNSLWTGLTFFHANNAGIGVTKTSNTVFSITGGTAYTGPAAVTVPSFTGTISGSGTGRIFVYLNLASSNAITVGVPSGITVAATGATIFSTAALGGSGGTCDVSDFWPKGGANGENSAQELACVDVVSGAITAVTVGNPINAAHNAEGDTHTVAGIGPGPWKIEGNESHGAGIVWFFDDSGNGSYRGNYYLHRNLWISDLTYLTTSSTSDGYRYFHRQHLEWKGGQYIWVDGDNFSGGWIEDNNNSPFVALTPTPSANGGLQAAPIMTDVSFTNNTFAHGAAILEGPYVYCSGAGLPCSPPISSVLFQNNLAYDINGYTYRANNPNTSSGNNTPGNGWLMSLFADEDFVFDHNTIGPQQGRLPWIFSIDGIPQEGFTVTNNFLWYSGVPTQFYTAFSGGNQPLPGCSGLGDINYLNCGLLSGPSHPSFTFANNVIAGGYTDTSVPSGQPTLSALQAAFAGLTNTYVVNGTVASTYNAIGWVNPTITSNNIDFSLKSSSSYIAGNNVDKAADAGANMQKLNAAQGKIAFTGVPNDATLTTTSAVLAFVAPDTLPCRVDLSTTDANVVVPTFSFTDSTVGRPRNTPLSGLSAHTFYYGHLQCAGNQSTTIFFKLRTR